MMQQQSPHQVAGKTEEGRLLLLVTSAASVQASDFYELEVKLIDERSCLPGVFRALRSHPSGCQTTKFRVTQLHQFADRIAITMAKSRHEQTYRLRRQRHRHFVELYRKRVEADRTGLHKTCTFSPL